MQNRHMVSVKAETFKNLMYVKAETGLTFDEIISWLVDKTGAPLDCDIWADMREPFEGEGGRTFKYCSCKTCCT